MGWIINTRLLSNPANWFSLAAMLLLVAAMFVAIKSRLAISSTSAVDTPDNPVAAYTSEK